MIVNCLATFRAPPEILNSAVPDIRSIRSSLVGCSAENEKSVTLFQTEKSRLKFRLPHTFLVRTHEVEELTFATRRQSSSQKRPVLEVLLETCKTWNLSSVLTRILLTWCAPRRAHTELFLLKSPLTSWHGGTSA
jgi:hypothetical protein